MKLFHPPVRLQRPNSICWMENQFCRRSAKLRDRNAEPFRPAARKKLRSWFFVAVGGGGERKERRD
jgi:hypothetical protein